MCTNEGRLDPRDKYLYVRTYLVGLKYDKIVDLHKSKPDKAEQQLEKLIRNNLNTMITGKMSQSLDEWRRDGRMLGSASSSPL